MLDPPARVLVVDPMTTRRERIREALDARSDYLARACADAPAAAARVVAGDVDAVLVALHLVGEGDGLALCHALVDGRPSLPVIVLCDDVDARAALGALRAGACDVASSMPPFDHLFEVLARSIHRHRLTLRAEQLPAAAREAVEVSGMVGRSPAMRRLFDMIERLAPTDVSVMVTGESGTGKELVARALHEQGRRRRGRFVAINCAAMPETLLESELFGHARGAFTGATEDHVGLFVQADGGTLLLDEIGELSLGTQAKLLRALQERKVRPVGATREVGFDVRLVAATNRDLEAEVAAKRFRDDLFYRVNVVRITTPTLRARGDDILLLAQRFVERFAARYGSPVEGLAPAAVARLMGYRWPGNVRELENAMERAVALCRGHRIDVEDLPDEVVTPKRPVGPGGFVMDAEALEPLEALERRYILHVLDLTDGNKSRAAEILQVDRKTLYRKLERYGEAR